MKKLMKALAFTTVACMLLSTAAFAEELPGDAEMTDASTVRVTVEGVTPSTPISIVVTPSSVEDATGITSGNILYINQGVTDPNGDVTFPSVDTKDTNGVNIFLGYEGVGDAALKLVAEELILEPQDSITITPVTAEDIIFVEDGTDNDIGAAAVVQFQKAIDEGRSLAAMFWSIGYSIDGEADKAYIAADADVVNALNVCEGEVQLGIAFNAGAKNVNAFAVKVESVNAIFKTVKTADNSVEKVIFTDVSDAENEE